MTDDWIFIEAGKQCGWDDVRIDILRHQYFHNDAFHALCDMIAKHEAFKQKVSFALETFKNGNMHTMHDYLLEPFIIPKPKPDPLVEAMKEAGWSDRDIYNAETSLRAALEALGLEIRSKNDG
jgi:hypothetical protein